MKPFYALISLACLGLLGACDSGGSGAVDGATESPDAVATTDTVTETVPPDSSVTTTAAEDTTTPAEDAVDDTAEPGDAVAQEDSTLAPDTYDPTPPPITATFDTSIGDWTMNPGKETTKCVLKRLSNTEDAWVTQIRTNLAKGSHHMIIYVSDEAEEKPEPFNCDPFVETLKGQTYPLMITQIREETLTFPAGVAFRFKPNQMIRLESHYLNYFDTPITAHGDVSFDTIAADRVRDEANLLFYGNPDFSLPPGEVTSTPWRFLDVPAGTKVFAMTGHTHAYGTNVEIYYANDAADPGVETYPTGKTFKWDEPPVQTYDPPLEFAEGQGFQYRCTWDNTSDRTLRFGESATAEMCFFWAYYYPSQGYRLCVSPGGIGGGVAGDQVCCPGHWVCDYLNQFL